MPRTQSGCEIDSASCRLVLAFGADDTGDLFPVDVRVARQSAALELHWVDDRMLLVYAARCHLRSLVEAQVAVSLRGSRQPRVVGHQVAAVLLAEAGWTLGSGGNHQRVRDTCNTTSHNRITHPIPVGKPVGLPNGILTRYPVF